MAEIQPIQSGRMLRSRTRSQAKITSEAIEGKAVVHPAPARPAPGPDKRNTKPKAKAVPNKDVDSPAPVPINIPTSESKTNTNTITVTATPGLNPTILKGSRRIKNKVAKTPSFTESFTGRLNWKCRHFADPVTSTPNSDKKQKTPRFTIENGFGLFNSSSEDESINISPISKTSTQILAKAAITPTTSPIPHSSRQRASKPTTISKLAMEPASNRTPVKQIVASSVTTGPITTKPVSKLTEPTGVLPTPLQGNSPRKSKRVPNPKSKQVSASQSVLEILAKENEIHNFSELWDAYGNDDEAKKELGEFYIDPKTIKRTYPGRKSAEEKEEENEDPVPPKRSKESKKSKTGSNRPKKSSVKSIGPGVIEEPHHPNPHKTRETKLKPSDLEWIEKTRKEFEEIDNFQLNVVKMTHPEGHGGAK